MAARGRREGTGSDCSRDQFPFGPMTFGDQQEYDTVNVLSASECPLQDTEFYVL